MKSLPDEGSSPGLNCQMLFDCCRNARLDTENMIDLMNRLPGAECLRLRLGDFQSRALVQHVETEPYRGRQLFLGQRSLSVKFQVCEDACKRDFSRGPHAYGQHDFPGQYPVKTYFPGRRGENIGRRDRFRKQVDEFFCGFHGLRRHGSASSPSQFSCPVVFPTTRSPTALPIVFHVFQGSCGCVPSPLEEENPSGSDFRDLPIPAGMSCVSIKVEKTIFKKKQFAGEQK